MKVTNLTREINMAVEICVVIPYRKIFGGIKVWRIKTVGSLAEKNFGELKSICIGNVMEIVKIGDKTWQNAVICQIRQFFHCHSFLLYSN